MKARLQFFSHLKDIAGVAELNMDVSEGAKISDLLAELYAGTPQLREWDSSILIGAGGEFVPRDYVLQPNEEIAIMPPVQGG